MKRRLAYGSAIVLLAISVTLVIWQGSFNFGEYGPADPTQTFVYWAMSTLIFLLMVILGFILFRTGVKLYIERRVNREGSRIKTKLVIGALALSITPAFFLVLFSVEVLNRNLEKWFSRPVEGQRAAFSEVARLLEREMRDQARLQAQLLAANPATEELLLNGYRAPGFPNEFCRGEELAYAAVLPAQGNNPLATCGSPPVNKSDLVFGRALVESGGRMLGRVEITAKLPIDVAAQQAEVERYNRDYGELARNRKQLRLFYLSLIVLITLFVLFVATWIALFLSKQISIPIAALIHAAQEVRKGNLSYRVDVAAMDELAGLVRGFNEMTRDLEANSRELDARRRFTEAILESIPTGVISLDAGGRIQKVNRALMRIFPGDQVFRATRLEDLFPNEDVAEILYLMKRARRTGQASQQLELKSDRKTLHLSATVAAVEEKSSSAFVLVLEDTSDLLRAQKSAAWHEVARRIAHEIKNPLTPIALSAERITRQLDKTELPPEVRRIVNECTQTIARSMESVKSLVDEFSRFARFPAAQPSRCDLNEVVASALAVFEGRLDGIQIRTELAPGLPLVNLDRGQFERVVVNLVDNAAEAMQNSLIKKLYISTQPGAADTVELVVADTGCGVSAEDREKLFLPYFSTKGRGTGLGLAIASHIVAEHRAQIRVEENAPQGTRFTVEIPVAVEGSDHPALHPVTARV